MKPLRDWPLQRKLLLVMIASSVSALAVMCVVGILYELSTSRGTAVRELSAQADIIGQNCGAALAFNIPDNAEDTLAALKARPEIAGGWIYTPEGKVFARYPADAQTPELGMGERFEAGRLWIFRPIVVGNQTVGTVCLAAELEDYRARLRWFLATAAILTFLCVSVAWIVATRLQRIVTEPIRQLAQAADEVAKRRDYSLRATLGGADEVGVLAEAFNHMLAQIEQRDSQMLTSERRFRQVTENIREVFWLTDVAKQEMLYVSPAYETIWGRTVASLYAGPRSWLDAIHPDDRDRVLEAAMTRQVAGTFAELYRITRPDGSVRWIEDRAFPIKDADGKVYRIAGVADDVTERQKLERRILDISDQEKQRIGQDLHDGLCQHLTATLFACRVLQEKLGDRKLAEAADARQIMEFISSAIQQTREIARGLLLLDASPQALPDALKTLTESVQALSRIRCSFAGEAEIVVENQAVATHLYRIAQEALNNAIKHAEPTEIQIELRSTRERIRLTIQDNGAGVSAASARSRGLGLATMQQRARTMGASLTVEPAPQGGTRVTCILPRRTTS